MKKVFTLTILYKHPKVLLGLKKTKMGAGWYNGFGGKVEKGEEIETAARREVDEEVGIKVKTISNLGVINFKFTNKPKDILEVHIFSSNNFIGKPMETREMKPKWFSISKIPFDKMWPADKYWIPLALEDKKFTGNVLFNDKSEIVSFSFNLN